MSKNQIPAVLVLLFLFLLVSPWQNQAQTGRFPIIKPANVVEEIYAMKKKNPRLSAADLAAYGNALISKQGYDFSTLDCAIAEANGKNFENDPTDYDREMPFKYDLETLRRGTMTFEIMADSWGAPCGCSFDLPVTQIQADKWAVFANGKPIDVKRPKDFYFIEVKMLDKTFRKTIKTFYKPLDNDVVGISPDGTKIYTELSYDVEVNVMLEISDQGTFQIVPSKTPGIIRKTVELTSEQIEQSEAHSEIHHFKSGNKSYFLNYFAPCT